MWQKTSGRSLRYQHVRSLEGISATPAAVDEHLKWHDACLRSGR
jgi:hypothetical protein